MLHGKRILLVIGGGIAAYKALELIRRLRERGARVRCILTAGGAQFVTPLSVAALTGETCYGDLFSLTDEVEMGHIRLSREADLILVAPATADLMAKMAAGLADDLATTTLLATTAPAMIAPAMNTRMWEHAATRRNLATLRADGVLVVEPGAGDLACGEVGAGRLAEVPDILAAVERFFGSQAPLAGRRAIVTAGPTHEAIDPVRYLANRSSGRQGYAIAGALAGLGAEVVLVSGPTALAAPEGVRRVDVESAEEMRDAVEAALPADIAVCVAAVADWRPREAGTGKLRKTGKGAPALDLVETPDILTGLARRESGRPALVVGFAAETGELARLALAKRASKGCDWLLANDVSPESGIMGGAENEILFVTRDGVAPWPRTSKDEVARRLAERIAAHFG